MANSYIVFEFEDVERLNDENIHFNIRNLDSLQNAYFNETYKDTGRTTGKVLPTTPNDIPLQNLTLGERYALDFFNFVKIDYSGIGLFNIIINSNIVTITAKNHNWDFLQATSLNGVNATLFPTDYSPSTYEIVDSSITESDVNKCGNFKILIQTTELTTDVVLNGAPVIANNTENPFSLEINRDIPFTIEMYNISSERLLYGSANGIPSFSLENNDLIINQSLHGATIIVNPKSLKEETILGLIDLEYSIDDINWQDSNIFSGQANGTGKIYVRDSLGCKKSILYEVKPLGTRNPFLFLSKANSVNFIKIENIDDYEVFKNNDNSFSSLNSINYCLPNLFNTRDITRIQFKSNFETINVILRNEDNIETNINLEKKTSNLNRFEKMDCKVYSYKSGQTGIYFDSGKTYSKSGTENGTYILNGNLPDMAVIGGYISLSSAGIFEIKNVLFDADKRKKIIVIDYILNTGGVLDDIIESVYDLLPYEVYEFEIDWVKYGDGFYDIYIENSKEQIINGSAQNLHLYSEDFILGSTQDRNVHLTANVALSPNGEVSATSIVENTVFNSNHDWFQGIDVEVGGEYIFEISAKSNGRDKLRINELGGNSNAVIFDLTNGTHDGDVNNSIEDQGNGWWRCRVAFTSLNGTSAMRISIVDSNNNYFYTGDGVSGLYIWGAQLIDVNAESLEGYIKTLDTAILGSLDEEISSEMYILQSYNIHVSGDHSNTLAIAYWNENNRDIFYKYGIRHFKRIVFDYVEAGILDESDLNIGDLTIDLNNSSVYETDTFYFTDLTDEEMRTLSIALSSEYVFINGIGYLKNGNLGVESIENTNLHELKAEMIKTNINYNTNTQGQEGVDYGYIPFNIPAFINADGSFIKV